MKSKEKSSRSDDYSEIQLSDALAVIKPKRADEAYMVLSLCCLYLQIGEPMPSAVRRWLDLYLTNERRQISGKRGLAMTNLSVKLKATRAQKEATGRGKITLTVEEYARALGMNESTVKKWRRKPAFAALAVVQQHMDLVIRGKFGP